jgi:hypothetical protein
MGKIEYTNLVHAYSILVERGAEVYGRNNGAREGVWL